MKDGLKDSNQSPIVYDTEVIEFPSSSSSVYSNNMSAEMLVDGEDLMASSSLEEMEKQSIERGERSVSYTAQLTFSKNQLHFNYSSMITTHCRNFLTDSSFLWTIILIFCTVPTINKRFYSCHFRFA